MMTATAKLPPRGFAPGVGGVAAISGRGLAGVCLCLGLLLGSGCGSIGPSTVKRDRMHYATVVSDSWKEQLLLNIVKTRYGDAPTFLEVASVVAGYSLETGVSLNGQFSPENLRGDTFAGGGLSGKFTDRPTISYGPVTGERFARSLMSPVPLDALMFVIQGGAPIDFVMGLTVQSFEGLHNEGIYGARFEPGDPRFARLLQLLRALREARALEAEVVKKGDQVEVWLEFSPAASAGSEVAGSLTELKSMLGVPAALDRVRVVFGTMSPEPGVVAIRTRSLLQIMGTVGAGVQVPEEHVASGSAVAVGSPGARRLLTVRSGRKQPEHAFVAVPYEGLWFWVEREDLGSKTTLTAVTILFSFLDNSGKQSAPVLTIPAN